MYSYKYHNLGKFKIKKFQFFTKLKLTVLASSKKNDANFFMKSHISHSILVNKKKNKIIL